jgi:hypothetical protein
MERLFNLIFLGMLSLATCGYHYFYQNLIVSMQQVQMGPTPQQTANNSALIVDNKPANKFSGIDHSP